MSYAVRILADSISSDGHRLTTFELVYQRLIHAELMTHRMFSRNAASSRAIPVAKLISAVRESPLTPVHWGKNQSGMQAAEQLTGDALKAAQRRWTQARDETVTAAEELVALGLHKQVSNRILEPYQWMTTIVTATDLSNFFALRAHPDAQPEFQILAARMKEAYNASVPVQLAEGEWHMPLVTADERQAQPDLDWFKVAVGRCARISYLTHEGIRDPQADIVLHDRLLAGGHMSPFEHVARPFSAEEREIRRRIIETIKSLPMDELQRDQLIAHQLYAGNFKGWLQYRKTLAGEHDFALSPAAAAIAIATKALSSNVNA